MRIDRPIGNESHLTGSFTGSFYGYFNGEHEGLSESIQKIYDTIDNVSENLDQRITDVSASINSDIYRLSGSFTETIDSLSGSAASASQEISASIHADIYRLSGSFDQDRTRLSASFDDTVTKTSASINTNILNISTSINSDIYRLSGSFDQDRTILSQSFDRDRTALSQSFATKIDTVSQSISGTISLLSHSFDYDRTQLSASFDGTIRDLDQDLQGQINTVRATYTNTASFEYYKQQVDRTYYKSGSSAILKDLIVSDDIGVEGNVTILGNIVVEGSSSIIHSEDVTIRDKFVEIASGAASPMEANGAGFGIQGADVTMSYIAENDSMNLNKPLIATSFTGSLKGNVEGNLLGNVTGSVQGTASYAGEIGDDGTIARAIKRLENVARVKTETADRGESTAILYLSCGAHKDYQYCTIDRSQVALRVGEDVVPGVEHYLLITNIGEQDCIITGSSGVMVPPSILNRYSWEYRYNYKYLEYTVPNVDIAAVQYIPGKNMTVFNGRIDGGDSRAVSSSRSIYIDPIVIEARASVPTPLTGSFVTGSGSGSGSDVYEDKLMIPKGQQLCLSYFTVDTSTAVITSAQRLQGQ